MAAHVGKGRVSFADVAREAGVSAATVNLALRNIPRIPLETRERIRVAVEATGYRYNRNTAALRRNWSVTAT